MKNNFSLVRRNAGYVFRYFWLAAAILIFGHHAARGKNAFAWAASSDYSEEAALKLAFPGDAAIEKRRLWFSPEDRERLANLLESPFNEKNRPYYIGTKEGKIVGLAFIDHVIGKTEPITYMVVLSPDGAIDQVEILAFREPQGYEVKNKKWRDQFSGKRHGALLGLKKDIDVISGATLSCRAITNGVKRILAVFHFSLQEGGR